MRLKDTEEMDHLLPRSDPPISLLEESRRCSKSGKKLALFRRPVPPPELVPVDAVSLLVVESLRENDEEPPVSLLAIEPRRGIGSGAKEILVLRPWLLCCTAASACVMASRCGTTSGAKVMLVLRSVVSIRPWVVVSAGTGLTEAIGDGASTTLLSCMGSGFVGGAVVVVADVVVCGGGVVIVMLCRDSVVGNVGLGIICFLGCSTTCLIVAGAAAARYCTVAVDRGTELSFVVVEVVLRIEAC